MQRNVQTNKLQRHLEAVTVNSSSTARRYVSPGYVKSCSPLPVPCLRNRQPSSERCGCPLPAARLRHGGSHPATAHVPLVHGGHLSGCLCVPLRADTRWETHNSAACVEASSLHLFPLCVAVCVSLLAGNSLCFSCCPVRWRTAQEFLLAAARKIYLLLANFTS